MNGILLLILRILLSLSLFAFLGWALYLLWKDLQQQSVKLASRPNPPITLNCNGFDEPVTFLKHEILIGRGPASDYAIDDVTVSTQHARLSFHHNQWWVEDLESTNGTFLNEERVTSPLVVVSGDELRLGQMEIEVMIEETNP